MDPLAPKSALIGQLAKSKIVSLISYTSKMVGCSLIGAFIVFCLPDIHTGRVLGNKLYSL